MKTTLNWLKQYVDFDWPPEELRERLTLLGLEVEGMQKVGGEFAGVVVAQVVTREKHPNRRAGRAPDRLRRAEFPAG
jgi:phenylalanyl-tRNA synthetase beta chain